MCTLTVLLVGVLVCVAMAPSAMARDPQLREEVRGDGDDLGGFRDPGVNQSVWEGGESNRVVVGLSEGVAKQAPGIQFVWWFWFHTYVIRF